ncbi:hypothetical protein KIKIMORA_04060 [Brevundimonas phage vB_BpoS-Kikimora]|uniref:Uncharacterized protein n=1 Tax=Brevundimonas phage vB_BpoS-Kikimora TaxID=2948601 RepID=A0A9E7MS98_9CAUD|nr:hypothetical protein KIKIMORA_04060 [Brevundimonas phage vB_BpoS-Kikimora]
MSNSVVVYSPSGEAEMHTRANARDLVNGCGYSWIPGVKASPNHYAPFATAHVPEGPSPSQKVLDAAQGQKTSTNDGANAALLAQQQQVAQQLAMQQAAIAAAQQQAAAPAAPVVDYSKVEAVDASDLDDPADAEPAAEDDAAPARPARRGRAKK